MMPPWSKITAQIILYQRHTLDYLMQPACGAETLNVNIIHILVGTVIFFYHWMSHGKKLFFNVNVIAWNKFSMMLHANMCCHFDPNPLQDKGTLFVKA